MMRSRHLVEPEALEFIEGLPTLNLSMENLAQLRRSTKQASREANAHSARGVTRERFTAPGIQGGPDVSVTVYSPEASTSPRAALLHIHGGGYVNGDAEGEPEWSEWFVRELK